MITEKLVKVKLVDIECNPNRDLKFNPFNEEKITALVSSISETGFWTNVILRPHPDKKGKYQQAYGHHRMEAARRSKITEAEFVVQNLDDNMMLKMMELENQEDYRYCPLSLLESVKAVVKALAEGRIAPFYVPEDGTTEYNPSKTSSGKWQAQTRVGGTQKYLGSFETKEEATQAYRKAVMGKVILEGNVKELRCAPKFSPLPEVTEENTATNCLYLAQDIARFLGHTKERTRGGEDSDPKIRTALDALYLLETKVIKTSDFKNMNWAQLGKFVSDLKRRKELERRNSLEAAEKVKEITKERIALEKANKEQAAQLQKQREEARKAEREAIKKKAVEDAKVYREKQKEIEKKDAARKVKYDAERPVFEEKIAAVKKEVIEAAQKAQRETALRKQVDAFIFKVSMPLEDHSAMREEIDQLCRKVTDTTQRMRIRNALSAASTWFDEQCIRFFGPPPKVGNVLTEAYKKEEAQRKKETE